MTIITALKAALIWLVIACLAVANGILRDNIISPVVGVDIALPLSGLTLSMIVFIITYIAFDFIGISKQSACFLIGTQWVLMTLVFEFLLAHFIAGKSWPDVLQTFNVASGNLFTLVLLTSLMSPYMVSRIKGVL